MLLMVPLRRVLILLAIVDASHLPVGSGACYLLQTVVSFLNLDFFKL